jgi:hypothetical protein
VLARRLESAEEIPRVEYARLYSVLRADIGAAFEPICGGHMIFAGLNSPIGHAVGMDFDGAVKDSDLDRLEAFYGAHNAPARLDICPLSDASLLELVKARGYSIVEMNNMLHRSLVSIEDVTPLPEVEILPARSEDALQYSQIVTRRFFRKGKRARGLRGDAGSDVSMRTDVDVLRSGGPQSRGPGSRDEDRGTRDLCVVRRRDVAGISRTRTANSAPEDPSASCGECWAASSRWS